MSSSSTADSAVSSDTVDLQVDYWMVPPRTDAPEKADKTARKEVKCSLKTMFRSMRVFRMQTIAGGDAQAQPNALSMIVVTREKKQKSMCRVLRLFMFKRATFNNYSLRYALDCQPLVYMTKSKPKQKKLSG